MTAEDVLAHLQFLQRHPTEKLEGWCPACQRIASILAALSTYMGGPA